MQRKKDVLDPRALVAISIGVMLIGAALAAFGVLMLTGGVEIHTRHVALLGWLAVLFGAVVGACGTAAWATVKAMADEHKQSAT